LPLRKTPNTSISLKTSSSGNVISLSRISHVLRENGLKQTVRKSLRTVSRYGFSSRKMKNNVRTFTDICRRQDAQGCTLFVPGAVLSHNGEFIASLQGFAEFGLHGLRHIHYDELGFEDQLKDFKEGWGGLDSAGIKNGRIFRAPYGRTNGDTLRALKECGCAVDSSRTFLWDTLKTDNPLYAKALEGYTLSERSAPYMEGGILEVPFSLPDDEMLVDRLDLPAEKVAAVWNEIVAKAAETDQLFVLQLHPNRMVFLKETLGSVIKEAKDRSMPVGSIGAVSGRWKAAGEGGLKGGAVCITGDIDAMSAWELMR